MRMLLYIIGSAALASSVSLCLQYAIAAKPIYEQIGNGVFFLALATCAFRSRDGLLDSASNVIGGPFGFVVISLLLTLTGTIAISWSTVLGVALMAFMGLGYYPVGPDVPFVSGFFLWMVSVLALIACAVGGGRMLRAALRRSGSRRG